MAEYAWRPLGELLVERGLIDEYQLEPLLLEQRLSGQLFGELLVSKRVVSPVDMAAVIAEQHGSISSRSTTLPRLTAGRRGTGVRSAASSWPATCSRRAAFSACCSHNDEMAACSESTSSSADT